MVCHHLFAWGITTSLHLSKNPFQYNFFISIEMEQTIEFVPLDDYIDYEILSQYPFTIRRKDNHYVVKETININNGYPSVHINGNKINKHQIIAKQFIPNPNNFKYIDHINKDRTDYHLENLRWCTLSDNNKNTSSRNGVKYEFVDNIPDDSIMITHYQMTKECREFNDKEYYYYYNEETDEDIFYQRITDEVYRIMHINVAKGGRKFIMTRDINRKKTPLYIHSFKFQYCLE